MAEKICLNVLLLNRFLFNLYGDDANKYTAEELINLISNKTGIPEEAMYLTENGHILEGAFKVVDHTFVRVGLRTLGGKGGFGSMLRAIGAQIEKTTNREACRDLSGRRLRDINEEQRLRNWLSKQGERDKEAAERRKARLERLCAAPAAPGAFADASYDAERAALPERISDAIEAGLQASTSRSMPAKADLDEPEGAHTGGKPLASAKRRANGNAAGKSKKIKLWIDADLPECSSDSEEEDQEAAS